MKSCRKSKAVYEVFLIDFPAINSSKVKLLGNKKTKKFIPNLTATPNHICFKNYEEGNVYKENIQILNKDLVNSFEKRLHCLLKKFFDRKRITWQSNLTALKKSNSRLSEVSQRLALIPAKIFCSRLNFVLC